MAKGLLRKIMAFTRNASVAAAILATTVGLKAAEPPRGPAPVIDLGTVTKELQGLCTEANKTDAAEEATLKTYTSVPLRKALRSGPEMWSFLIDPSTSYLDRIAVANQGGQLMGTAELPQLWKAVAAFEALPIGVTPSPCDFLFSANLSPRTWAERKEGQPVKAIKDESRLILGQKVELPQKNVDYPVTSEERSHAPWPWQMKRALAILTEKVGDYYVNPERYPLLVGAAWRWHPANWNEASTRSRALLEPGPRNALWIQMIVKLALEDPDPNVASSVSRHLSVWGNDTYHFEELVHTAQIVILQKTQSEPVAALTAYWTERLARQKYVTAELRPLRTSTAILAMGRWAMDRDLDPWHRYYSYVNPICKTVDNPPLQPGLINDPKSPDLATALKAFEEWFTKQRNSLEQEAAAERPHLQSLASELSLKVE
jgi:hypothetical protein